MKAFHPLVTASSSYTTYHHQTLQLYWGLFDIDRLRVLVTTNFLLVNYSLCLSCLKILLNSFFQIRWMFCVLCADGFSTLFISVLRSTENIFYSNIYLLIRRWQIWSNVGCALSDYVIVKYTLNQFDTEDWFVIKNWKHCHIKYEKLWMNELAVGCRKISKLRLLFCAFYFDFRQTPHGRTAKCASFTYNSVFHSSHFNAYFPTFGFGIILRLHNNKFLFVSMLSWSKCALNLHL